MENWVKLDPYQLGQSLSKLATSKECGEWIIGFQAGASGAILRRGCSSAEADGHEVGRLAREQGIEDRKRISELNKARARKRWDRPADAVGGADGMPRHGSGNAEEGAPGMPREERRGEESSPQGGRTAGGPATPPPSGSLPGWKAAKVAGLRLKLDDANRTLRIEGSKRDRGEPNEAEDAKRAVDRLRSEILVLGVEP